MNRLVLRNLLVLAVLLGLAPLIAHGAAAQNAVPALRANVTVAGDVVRIGDLIEHAGPVADIPIFRSPDLGTRGAVATDAILDAVRPHQLIEIDTRGLAEVIVTRASRAITVPEIVARIAQALSEEYGMGEARNITVNFDREARPIHIEASATGELQVTALSYDPRNARFDVTFDLPSSAVLHRRPARLSGTAIETVAAVTVEHPVEHGEVLKASDLTVLRRPKAEGGNITDVNAVLGLAARRPLRPGQPIHDADLMKPELVQRNATVTIVYEAPGLVLTLRGQAQDAGALGDAVNVLNAQSKRVVQGVVSGPDRVTIKATTTRLASAPEKPE